MPPDTVWISVVVFVGWMLGGIVGGATGVGSIMVAMPILTTVLPAGEAVLISCLIGVYGCMHLALAYRRDCVWPDIRALGIGIVPGCVIGVLALKLASVRTLELMISAMLAVFVLLRLFRKATTYRLPESTVLGAAAGTVCGFVASSVAMVGAPLGIYALLRHWEPDRARGNMSVIYIFTSLGAVTMQALSGLYTMELLRISLAGIAGCALGQFAGVRLGRNIKEELFNRLILTFLAVAALVLCVRAVG
ncbi:MAG: sulfite exporter TauE/SafE family protein [Desulfovibrionaceae bacterium]|nr:sulfite exporter TauE/SafE family protein [Desulfovibrionaceae bacterium]